MQRAPTCVIVLSGLPGSGKTTLANKLMYHVESHDGHQACTVCFDEFVTSAPVEHEQSGVAAFSPASWKDGRQAGLAALEQLLKSVKAPPGSLHQLVLVDDTMHYRSMRHVCFQLARKYGAAYLQLHVSCSTEQAIEWNKGRPPAQQVPDNVIRSTAAMFEDPSSSPFRWESKTLVVDANVGIASLWGRIWEAWGPPVPPLPSDQELLVQQGEARRATHESLLHQLDLACRRQVKECLRQAGEVLPGRQQRAALAKRLSAQKRRLLVEARQAELACEKPDDIASASAAQNGCSGGLPTNTGERDGVPSGDGCSCVGVVAESAMLEPWVANFRSQCDDVLAEVLCEGLQGAPG